MTWSQRLYGPRVRVWRVDEVMSNQAVKRTRRSAPLVPTLGNAMEVPSGTRKCQARQKRGTHKRQRHGACRRNVAQIQRSPGDATWLITRNGRQVATIGRQPPAPRAIARGSRATLLQCRTGTVHDRRSRTSRATFRNRAAPTGRTPRAKTAARVRSRARNRAPTPEAYRAGLRTTFVQPFLRWSKFS
jgi:hypothetical protein